MANVAGDNHAGRSVMVLHAWVCALGVNDVGLSVMVLHAWVWVEGGKDVGLSVKSFHDDTPPACACSTPLLSIVRLVPTLMPPNELAVALGKSSQRLGTSAPLP